MKFVKKSISIPEDLSKFAEKKAAKIAKERGGALNISGYVAELLAEQKRREDLPRAA